MVRRWVIIVFILLVVSFLLWGQTKSGVAQERFYSIRIVEKLDKILENQVLILDRLKGLKEDLKTESAKK